MTKIIVIGGGGHAKVLICVLKKNHYTITGFTDPSAGNDILGIPHLGDDERLLELADTGQAGNAVIGLGKINTSNLRLQLQRKISRLGFTFPVIASPTAIINEGTIFAPGTVVFDNVVVNSGTTIGEACILNTGCIVEHDCRFGDNVHIAPGATISGGVAIGDNCMIGAGATVIQAMQICADTLVGAGATVIESITEPGIYAGCPAQKIS